LTAKIDKLNGTKPEILKQVVYQIVGKIEEEYGRMNPLVAYAEKYDSKSGKKDIELQIKTGKHIM